MGRYELTDEQWQKIEKMFPANKGKRGGQWQDHRQVVNGMIWILCSGAPWRDLPERYGNWKRVYDRFRRYRIDGFFGQLLRKLQVQLNKQGLIDFHLWHVDSTTVRAHKSAAGAGLKRGAGRSKASHRIMP
jgi:transposase